MKQVFGVFLSLVYLLLIVGVPISVHHCNSEDATNISFWSSAACSCSIKQENESTCCAIAEEAAADHISTSCGVSESDESCCSYQNEIINWNPEQQVISSFCVVFSQGETELFMISDKMLEIPNVSNEKPDELGLSPPIKLSKVILQHQFIFYA